MLTMAKPDESTPTTDTTTDRRTAVRSVAEVRALRGERVIRVLNVSVALLGLLLTLPLWIVIAALIKLTSRGPVFYTQTRVGLDTRDAGNLRHDSRRVQDLGGKPFTIYKFRTMTVDAERHGQAVWATANDQRVTAVGGFLRSCRLDELPQLLNVLRGEMNIVGPRPERPQLFAELRDQIPQYSLRQRVPPGITGHAQVHLQYDTSVEDVKRKVLHDLEYIARRSAWEDFKIMLKTIPVMLFRKGGW
jgi:lipopolysaccharide/colanic/teichoic acid biosynthesis glycosyltransferase